MSGRGRGRWDPGDELMSDRPYFEGFDCDGVVVRWCCDTMVLWYDDEIESMALIKVCVRERGTKIVEQSRSIKAELQVVHSQAPAQCVSA